MTKNRFFLISMIAVCVALFLLRFTGITAHIIVSVIGLAIMIPISIKTFPTWKLPALEIIMRIMYFLTIISGGILINVHNVVALSVGHKITAVLFVILLLVLYIPKWNKD